MGTKKFVADDLMIDIISRLPTKSLRRFQCASKSWNHFISEVSSRRRVLLPMSGIYFSPRNYAPLAADSRLCLPLGSRRWFLIHGCNGLLLFANKIHIDYSGHCSYRLWNPTTKETVAIPPPPTTGCTPCCFLAFDPRKSPHYKLVRFESYEHVMVEIYSSMSGNWVKLKLPFEYYMQPYNWLGPGNFHDGVLYMVYERQHLVWFDVEERNFQVQSLPEEGIGNNDPLIIGESRGRLYCAVYSYTRFDLRVWMFDNGGTVKWPLVHTISSEVFVQHRGTLNLANATNDALDICPINFNPDSEVIYLIAGGNMVVACHPSNKRLEVVYRSKTNLPNNRGWTRVFAIIPCVESIKPPGAKFFRG